MKTNYTMNILGSVEARVEFSTYAYMENFLNQLINGLYYKKDRLTVYKNASNEENLIAGVIYATKKVRYKVRFK